ncbi:MAG: cytochrome c3 family protein [Nitrospirae bacterium]|nr:cytochrome c3 family protein [Nitrospirota bacterium]
MKICKLMMALFLFLVLIAFASRYSLAQENPCLMCHVSFKQPAKHVHAVLNMGCETCHAKVEGSEHPKQKKSIKLTQDMPALCYGCHKESKFKGETVHSPVASGMCTGCHDAHQSNFNHILKSASPDLCYMCHKKSNFTRKYVHMAIPAVGCGTCHAPHVSSNPALLPRPVNDLCLSCHAAKAKLPHVVALPGDKRHPIMGVKDPSTIKMINVPDPKRPERQIEVPDPDVPGKEMTCVSCHDPHSSDFRGILVQERICIKCHKF